MGTPLMSQEVDTLSVVLKFIIVELPLLTLRCQTILIGILKICYCGTSALDSWSFRKQKEIIYVLKEVTDGKSSVICDSRNCGTCHVTLH